MLQIVHHWIYLKLLESIGHPTCNLKDKLCCIVPCTEWPGSHMDVMLENGASQHCDCWA